MHRREDHQNAIERKKGEDLRVPLKRRYDVFDKIEMGLRPVVTMGLRPADRQGRNGRKSKKTKFTLPKV
jgi:hypothetical protein